MMVAVDTPLTVLRNSPRIFPPDIYTTLLLCEELLDPEYVHSWLPDCVKMLVKVVLVPCGAVVPVAGVPVVPVEDVVVVAV